jgi:DNA-binding transcriptional LysR family regulator
MSGIVSAGVEANQFKRARMTTLRLGITSAIQPGIFEPAITKLLQASPSIRVDVREGPGDWIIHSLLTDEIDVGVSASNEYPELIEAAPLYEQRFGIVLPVEHPLARSAEVSLSDLTREKIISVVGYDGLEHLLAEAQINGLQLNNVVTTNSESWALDLTANGFGVTIMPMKPVYCPRITVRPLEGPLTRVLSLITMRGRRRMGTAEQFIRNARRLAVRNDLQACAP